MKKRLVIPIFFLFSCASIEFISTDILATMEDFKNEGLPFMIVAMYTGTPNAVGGVDAYVIPRITTPKTIKYVSMTFSVYNAVGDEVFDSKWGGEFILNSIGFNDFTGKVTGPLNIGDKVDWWKWDNAWYNSDIHCLKLRKVNVEYMDGGEETFKGEKITKLYAPKDLRIKGAKYWSCDW